MRSIRRFSSLPPSSSHSVIALSRPSARDLAVAIGPLPTLTPPFASPRRRGLYMPPRHSRDHRTGCQSQDHCIRFLPRCTIRLKLHRHQPTLHLAKLTSCGLTKKGERRTRKRLRFTRGAAIKMRPDTGHLHQLTVSIAIPQPRSAGPTRHLGLGQRHQLVRSPHPPPGLFTTPACKQSSALVHLAGGSGARLQHYA